MTQSPRSGKKRSSGSSNVLTAQAAETELSNGPYASSESIRAQLRLLDLRLESLQKDIINLTASRQHVTLARSQYRTQSNLKFMDQKFGKKGRLD